MKQNQEYLEVRPNFAVVVIVITIVLGSCACYMSYLKYHQISFKASSDGVQFEAKR